MLFLVVVVVVCSSLLYTSPASGEPTTCGVGSACSGCQGNKVGILRLTSGKTVKVCCPGCISQYFNHGIKNGTNYCNCNYLGISGSANKGEECSATGMKEFFRFNKMPICCPSHLKANLAGNASNGKFVFNCVSNGNCWRGSQCANCNQGFVGRINGEAVCCSECRVHTGGIKVGPGSFCNCN